jgi:hypothetical protein
LVEYRSFEQLQVPSGSSEAYGQTKDPAMRSHLSRNRR